MNATHIVNNLLSSVTNNMHKTRLNAVSACVVSLLTGSSSTVTDIGRGLKSSAKEKHKIKRADRVCSNLFLQTNLVRFYRHLTRRFVVSNRPIIHVDWSDLDAFQRNFLIRATVAFDGRPLTIYQEVHPLSTKEKPAIHLKFLTRLKTILHSECKPIIVTDAGFKVPWFRQVLGLGWDFLGRTRKPNFYVINRDEHWKCISEFYKKASRTPKSFNGKITRSNPLSCRLVLFKSPAKDRHHLNRKGKRHASGHSKQHARGAGEPWLLSTSLKQNQTLGRRAVAIYKTRMQIEEGFRDMKSQKTGLGFNASQSRIEVRIAVLLFLNVIASIVLILIGFAVVIANQHYQYQANTVRTRRVLSFHFIGLRACSDEKFRLLKRQLSDAMDKIHKIIDEVSYSISFTI